MKLRTRFLAVFAVVLLSSLLTGCIGLGGGNDQALTARLDSILTRLEDTGAIVTARVVELPDRRELYARDIDVPYTPASNMKVPVSAAGLDMFGPDHIFKTYLALDGDDLWIIGTGDPGIGDPRLARARGELPTAVFDTWANALAARGLTHIPGQLYYFEGLLDDELTHPTWGEDALHWYGAPTSGLNFNDNCVDITIYPTGAGEPVRYDVMPPVENITIINECITADVHEPTIEKLPGGNIYKLGGTCAAAAELKSKPVEQPGAFFCDAFSTHLAARGITIDGDIRRASAPLGGTIPPNPEQIVAVHETPLADVIGRINTNSQNFFAEAVCKLTGRAWILAQEGRHVPGSWSAGGRAIHAFLRRVGIDDRHLEVVDGSGLSDENKLTSRMMTDLFAVMFDRPDGEIFRASLAKGGVDGTLRKRFAGVHGRVFAKTGYISGVRALSGYIRTYDDRWLTFSIIYNQIPGSVEPYEELQDEAVRLLLRWPNIDDRPDDPMDY